MQPLADGDNSVQALKLQQQEQGVSISNTRNARKALIKWLEQRLQHAETSLHTDQERLRAFRQEADALLVQKKWNDEAERLAMHAVEALTINLLAARSSSGGTSPHVAPNEQTANIVQHVQAAKKCIDQSAAPVEGLQTQLVQLNAVHANTFTSAQYFTKAQTLLKTMTSDLGKSLKQRQQNVQNTQATLNALSNNLSVEPAKHVSNVAAERATPGQSCKHGQCCNAVRANCGQLVHCTHDLTLPQTSRKRSFSSSTGDPGMSEESDPRHWQRARQCDHRHTF